MSTLTATFRSVPAPQRAASFQLAGRDHHMRASILSGPAFFTPLLPVANWPHAGFSPTQYDSPSPLHGVRGGNVLKPHSRNIAAGVTTPHPQSLSPLRGEGSSSRRVLRSSVQVLPAAPGFPPTPHDILPLHEPERRFVTGLARPHAPSRLETGAPPRFRGTKRERSFVASLPAGEGRGEGERNAIPSARSIFKTQLIQP